MLAALARRPRGLVSARAVARACGIAPSTAARAVRSLVAIGLVIQRDQVVTLDRSRRVRLITVNVRHPRWGALLPTLTATALPTVAGPSATDPMPRSLQHAFWNVSDTTYATLTPATDGSFIATRALTTLDPNLLAYAAATVAPSDWDRATRTRGLSPTDREFALLFASPA